MWDHETIMMIVQGVGETQFFPQFWDTCSDFLWECCWQCLIKRD